MLACSFLFFLWARTTAWEMIDELETRLWMEYWLSPREAVLQNALTARLFTSETLRPQEGRFLHLPTVCVTCYIPEQGCRMDAAGWMFEAHHHHSGYSRGSKWWRPHSPMTQFALFSTSLQSKSSVSSFLTERLGLSRGVFIPSEFRCQMEYKISPSTLLVAGLLFQSASSTLFIRKETYQDALTTPPFSSSVFYKSISKRG